MSRFFKQVVSLSKTPEDFKKKLVTIPPTETVPPTVTELLVDSEPHIDSVSPTDSVVGSSSSLRFRPDSNRYSRPKPRLAKVAQDGHSHAEQALYAALWDGGSPDSQGNRTITIGLGRLSRLARLSENNCRLNARSLVRKLALEEIGEENSRASIGKTYRVFSYSAILQRRKEAGLEWVLRTKGVSFVRPDGTPLPAPYLPSQQIESVGGTESAGSIGRVGEAPTESGPAPPTYSVPPYRNLFRKELQEVKTSSSSLIEEVARKHGLVLDDDIIRRIQISCKRNEPAATDEEIAYLLEIKINQLKGSRSIDNLAAVLVKAVANLFPSNELQRYRVHKAREHAQSRELAHAVLTDPESSDTEREWARVLLGGEAIIS